MPIEIHAERRRVEVYLYLNGDNDLIDINSRGEVYHQSQKMYALLKKWQGEKIATHIYWDRVEGPTLFEKNCPQSQDTRELNIETDSMDPIYLTQLIEQNCFEDSEKILIFWGHGSSWTPIGFDSSSNREGTWLDLLPAFDGLDHQFVGTIFDACSSMGLLTLNAFGEFSQYLVGSQFDLPAEGIQYPRDPKYLLSGWDTFYEKTYELTKRRQIRKGQFAPIISVDTRYQEKLFQEFNKFYDLLIMQEYTLAPPWIWNQQSSDEDAVKMREAIHWTRTLPHADPDLMEQADRLEEALEALLFGGKGNINFYLGKNEAIKISIQDRVEVKLNNWIKYN